MKAIYAIVYLEPWKSQDFNGIWTCDFAIPVRCSNRLSCEATNVGSWSFVGLKEPVRNECWSYIWNISYIELQMWNQVSYYPRSYERNSCNWVYRSLKKLRLQGGLNLWPRDTGVRLKPNELWSHWRWELEINHILIWISLLKMSYTFHSQLRIFTVSYTHLTLPTKLEV